MENMASCNKAELSFNHLNMLNITALFLRLPFEEVRTRQKVPCLQECPLSQGQKLTKTEVPDHAHLHRHSHTHKQASPTKTGRQKLPLLSHLWGNRMTSSPLICHTHLRAFFCRTTWSLCSGSYALPRVCCECVSRKGSQKCHKSSYYCVLAKFHQVQCCIHSLWQQHSIKVRSEKKIWK